MAGALSSADLGEPLVDGHRLGIGAGGHVAVGQKGGHAFERGTEPRAKLAARPSWAVYQAA